MVDVDSRIHALIENGASTRLRIYFYDGDCTDDDAVQTEGELLKGAAGDNDSGGRLSGQNPISIMESFCKEYNYVIGNSTSALFSATLLNFDGSLNDFQYGKCKLYYDIYDSSAEEWLACPMGVFIMDAPKKRRKALIDIEANDCMASLGKYADVWWYTDGLFGEDTTVISLMESLAEYNGYKLSADSYDNMLNADVSVTEMPFSCDDNMTFRDIVEIFAEATGTNARFDRNGYLDFCTWNETGITIDSSTIPTRVLNYEVAEYAVAPIDYVEMSNSINGAYSSFGEGDNGYKIIDNELIGFAIDSFANDIADRLMEFASYEPIDLRLIADYSIQAGDIVTLKIGTTLYKLPIFSQTLSMRGASVNAGSYVSSGDAVRPTISKSKKQMARITKTVHTIQNTVDGYESRFESTEGLVSTLSQDLNGLAVTVGNTETKLNAKLDAESAQITFNRINTSIAENTTLINTNQTNLEKYIRFVDGTIVLGRNDSEIKLKLVNNVVFFFSGDDTEMDINNAFAYFSNNQLYVRNVNSEDHVQIGTNSVNNYQFLKQDDGDLILRIV